MKTEAERSARVLIGVLCGLKNTLL